MPPVSPIYFHNFVVNSQVFYKTQYSYALVNLKPLVPGHVLICPLNKSIMNMSDLSVEEHVDFFKTVNIINQFIRSFYKADATNIAIQDGPEAGQTMPHLHAHVIPRYKKNNIGDEMYTKLDEWDARRNAYEGRAQRKFEGTSDEKRVPRTSEEMAAEAETLATGIKEFLTSNAKLQQDFGC